MCCSHKREITKTTKASLHARSLFNHDAFFVEKRQSLVWGLVSGRADLICHAHRMTMCVCDPCACCLPLPLAALSACLGQLKIMTKHTARKLGVVVDAIFICLRVYLVILHRFAVFASAQCNKFTLADNQKNNALDMAGTGTEVRRT